MADSRGSLLFLLWLLLLFMISSSLNLVASEPSSMCNFQPTHLFLNNLQSQCPPLSIPQSSVLEVDGASLDRVLSSNNGTAYAAILFYASWCPFSQGARSTFDVLNSKFPKILHLAVEQSSAFPSVFSRYGIHSVPSILMVNQTAKERHYGPKDVQSLVHFYKSTTGHVPIEYFTENQLRSQELGQKPRFWLLAGFTAQELFVKEPYLLLSSLFLILRVFLYLCPGMLSRIRDMWFFYIPHLNLGIFGETSQLVGRIVHLIDVKRVWSKMRWCKTRNFRQGAKNARVWASSFASVSLGESSSSRSSVTGDS
ncbi:hypothetical protein Syun_001515 [Stephania yunnanensis]|uniref:Thioredoxin domain-containing protein n=1 Tax=Stephania yunnanensis TaxID=152371 RepID=A0AAP0Q6J2_9MAGN